MSVADDERRAFLKWLAVFGVGGAIGYRTRDADDGELLGGVVGSGGGTATTVSSATTAVQIVIGTSAAAIDDEVDRTPALGLDSTNQNLYAYPENSDMADKYTLESGIQVIFAPTLADLEDAVDTYPAWGFATNDNETYIFQK